MWANANVMAALPNIGGTLSSTPQSVLTPNTRVPCSNVAKTRNLLKFAGVPQTTGSISAASGPTFTILWGHVEEILMLIKFFPIVNMCLRCEYIYSPTELRDGAQMAIFDDFLRPVFAASRAQQVSDLHSKFALRPRL